mmetsp:Transcript_81487/g.230908  ORF Transcript_81487/g.230908 Transcript_81487/m.230908 type:complete len:339 (+) Transcript_81487:257-1273(+)
MDSSSIGRIGFESMFKTLNALFCRSETARIAASGPRRFAHGRSSFSTWVFVSSATASFGEILGSASPLGIWMLEKSTSTRLGSSRWARCTTQIIQVPGLALSGRSSASWKAASSSGVVHESIRRTRSSSSAWAHASACRFLAGSGFLLARLGRASGSGSGASASDWVSSPSASAVSAAASPSVTPSSPPLFRRLPKLAFSRAVASWSRGPRPRSMSAPSMVRHTWLQVLTRWSSAFMVDSTVVSSTARIRAISIRSPPNMLASCSGSLFVRWTCSIMRSRAPSKVFSMSSSTIGSLTLLSLHVSTLNAAASISSTASLILASMMRSAGGPPLRAGSLR